MAPVLSLAGRPTTRARHTRALVGLPILAREDPPLLAANRDKIVVGILDKIAAGPVCDFYLGEGLLPPVLDVVADPTRFETGAHSGKQDRLDIAANQHGLPLDGVDEFILERVPMLKG